MMAPSSRRIIPFPTKRVTSTHTLSRPPGSAQRAVFADRIDRVLAARRLVAAVAAHPAAEGSAVHQDELNQEPTHDAIISTTDMAGDPSTI